MFRFLIRIIVVVLFVYYITAIIGGVQHLKNPKVDIFKFGIPFYYWHVMVQELKAQRKAEKEAAVEETAEVVEEK